MVFYYLMSVINMKTISQFPKERETKLIKLHQRLGITETATVSFEIQEGHLAVAGFVNLLVWVTTQSDPIKRILHIVTC